MAVATGGEVVLHDAATGESHARTRVVPAEAALTGMSLAWSAGGEQLAVGVADRVVLHDAALERVRVLTGLPADGVVGQVAFSPDGTLLAGTSGAQAHVWRTATGAHVGRFEHELVAADVEFSPDSRFLLTGSDEGWARVFDVESGDRLLRVAGQEQAWSQDGLRLVTVDAGRARVWACEVCRPLDELLELADRRVTRPLTAEERARYFDGA